MNELEYVRVTLVETILSNMDKTGIQIESEQVLLSSYTILELISIYGTIQYERGLHLKDSLQLWDQS